jgi:hypothetical protein
VLSRHAVPIEYSISRILKMKISPMLVALVATSAAAIAPVAVAGVVAAGYYANITGLGGPQSYGFIGFHGTTNEDDLFVWDSSISGSPVSGDMGLFNAYGGAVLSGFNAQGIGLYVSELSVNATPEFSMQQGFQSSEAFVMTWNSTYLANGGGFLRLAKFDDYTASNGGNQVGSTIDFATTPGPVTLGATVGTEYYKLFYASYGSAPVAQPGIWMMNVSFVAVPAPGALALLGVVGLAGRRRRS